MTLDSCAILASQWKHADLIGFRYLAFERISNRVYTRCKDRGCNAQNCRTTGSWERRYNVAFMCLGTSSDATTRLLKQATPHFLLSFPLLRIVVFAFPWLFRPDTNHDDLSVPDHGGIQVPFLHIANPLRRTPLQLLPLNPQPHYHLHQHGSWGLLPETIARANGRELRS